MRIAVLGDGSLTHTARWCGFFQSRGHDVMLFTFEGSGSVTAPSVELKKRLPTDLLGYLSSLWKLRREVSDFGPDVMSTLYVTGYGFIGALSCFRPLVVTALGSDLLIDYRRHFIHRAQIEYALKRADLITTDAESLSRAAIEAGATEDRIKKIYMGIDDSVFYPPEDAANGGSGKAGREPDPSGGEATGRSVKIISTRNLYGIYGVDLLVEAAPMILKKIEADFVICGDGPERKRLERKVRSLGLAGRFSFRGRLSAERLAHELRAADIYVSTSRSDSTSVSLLEGMACGLFPVVTDIEANREWIEDGVNGRVIESSTPSALAEAAARAAMDRELMGAARSMNPKIIRERGLWTPNMERLEKAMIDLVTNSR